MAKPKAKSPADISWHARRLGFDPESLTDEQWKRANSARRAYFAKLAHKSAKARRLRRQARNGGSAGDI